MTVLIWLVTAVHIVIALFLIVLVLMQKSSDQGVGAAFGGGVTESVFGAGTTSALVRITTWCAGIMFGTTVLLAIMYSHRGGATHESIMEKAMQTAPMNPTAPSSQPPSLPVPQITPTPATGTLTPSLPASPETATPPVTPATAAPAPATPAPSPAKP